MNFQDLDFYRHPYFGFQAVCKFENSYGLSILPESDGATYEVAVMRNGEICYDSGLTEDVFRYLTRDSVNDLFNLVQTLPSSSY
jgi:hypothetical protein